MARLQILELPEGSDDDRPPFVLVIDQAPADLAGFDALRRDLGDHEDFLKRIGARAVLVFEETIDIPANDTTAYLGASGDSRPEFVVELDGQELQGAIGTRLAHERTDIARDMDRLAHRREELADALGLSPNRNWDDIRDTARALRESNEERGEALDRVLGLPFDPEVMDAQHAEPTGYRHGYRIAIQDAKRAVGYQSDHPTEKQSRA